MARKSNGEYFFDILKLGILKKNLDEVNNSLFRLKENLNLINRSLETSKAYLYNINILTKELKKQNEISSKLDRNITWMTGVLLFFTIVQVTCGIIQFFIKDSNPFMSAIIYIACIILDALFYYIVIIPRLK